MSNFRTDEIVNSLPKSIRNIIVHQLSPEVLKKNMAKLSQAERKKLEEIKKELKVTSDDEIIKYLFSLIAGVAKPDRALLSEPLMAKLDKFKKLKYKDEVRQFKNKSENSAEDLYSIIKETLHSLWVKKYDKEEVYKKFEIYKDFEKILFKDPRYRDHFIHQFQVFLSGLPILEKHYETIKDTYLPVFGDGSKINLDFSWLLAASFHDIGYLVQQFDKWLNSFFKEFLGISELPINLDLGKLLL